MFCFHQSKNRIGLDGEVGATGLPGPAGSPVLDGKLGCYFFFRATGLPGPAGSPVLDGKLGCYFF